MAPSNELIDGKNPIQLKLSTSCSFDQLLEAADEKHEEPRTLEIVYATAELGEPQQEVVFEDLSQSSQRPRLLVSLQSVMSLKALCEREFARVEVITAMLNQCRCHYYKELLWLREQLLLATRPEQAVVLESVKNYEVYWYDPPQYVDGELKEFLLDCIRQTNKNLIEENFELLMKLEGKSLEDFSDLDVTLKSLIRKQGVGKLLKRLHGIVSSKEHGTPAQLEELEAMVLEVFPKLSQQGNHSAELSQLRAELEAVQSKAKQAEELKRALQESQAAVADEKNVSAMERNRVSAERERADAEQQRANSERDRADKEHARAEELQQQIAELQRRLEAAASGDNAMATAADNAATRIRASLIELGRRVKGLGAVSSTASAKPSAVHPGLEQALCSLEEAVVAAGRLGTPDGEISGLKERIRSLEGQLKQSREAEKAAKQALAEAEAQAATKQAPTKPEKDSGQLDNMRAELEKIKAELKKATEEAERAAAAEERLRQEKNRLEADNARLDKLSKDSAHSGGEALAQLQQQLQQQLQAASEAHEQTKQKLREAEEKLSSALDNIDELAMKVSRGQEKIRKLKDEIKDWKRRCGVEVLESDEEDSDDDLPQFLVSYCKRVRNSPKPRWLLLNEDAGCIQKKRDFLWGQRYHVSAIHAHEAGSVFQFMKRQRAPGPAPQSRPGQKAHRSQSEPPYPENFLAAAHALPGNLAGPPLGPTASMFPFWGASPVVEHHSHRQARSTEGSPARSRSPPPAAAQAPLLDAGSFARGPPPALRVGLGPPAAVPLAPTSKAPTPEVSGRSGAVPFGPAFAPALDAADEPGHGFLALHASNRGHSWPSTPVSGHAQLLPLKPPTTWALQPLAPAPQSSPSPALSAASLGRAMRSGITERAAQDTGLAPRIGATPLSPLGLPTPSAAQTPQSRQYAIAGAAEPAPAAVKQQRSGSQSSEQGAGSSPKAIGSVGARAAPAVLSLEPRYGPGLGESLTVQAMGPMPALVADGLPASASPGAAASEVRRPFLLSPSTSDSMGKLDFNSSHSTPLRRSGRMARHLSECSTHASTQVSDSEASPVTSLASPKAPRCAPGLTTQPPMTVHTDAPGGPARRTAPAGGLRASSSTGSLLGMRAATGDSKSIGLGAQFNPPLGQGEGQQAPVEGSAPTGSPKSRRSSMPTSQLRDVAAMPSRSRSAASLPLTNMAKVQAQGRASSPSKAKRPAATAGAVTSAKFVAEQMQAATAAGIGAEGAEAVLPEVLPPLPPGRVRKGAALPSWLVPA